MWTKANFNLRILFTWLYKWFLHITNFIAQFIFSNFSEDAICGAFTHLHFLISIVWPLQKIK